MKFFNKRFLVSLLLSFALLTPASAANPFSSKKASNPVAVTAAVETSFIPKFEVVIVKDGRYPLGQPANPRYFATDETAKVVMAKFGATQIEVQPATNNLGGQYLIAGGPQTGQVAVYRNLVFPVGALLRDGSGNVIAAVQAEFRVNAGILADEYIRNPEADFPEQHFVTGYPPVPGKYLSNAEQGAWRLLGQIAAAAKQAKDAEAAGTK